jgi:hypothetical protein
MGLFVSKDFGYWLLAIGFFEGFWLLASGNWL